jgi:ubiquinone/menaquinone biosynthesis C-methylase UbiE
MTESVRFSIDRYYRWISRFYGLHEGWFEKALRQKALRFLVPRPGETILEIGCGTGFALSEIMSQAGPSIHLHGLDISAEMLERARARLERFSHTVWLLRADARALPYADGSFDGGYMSGVLELHADPERAQILREAQRILKPGAGRLVLATMTDDGRARGLLRAYEWSRRVLPGIIPAHAVDSDRLASEAGFEILQKESLRLKGLVPIRILLLGRPRR